MRSEQACDGEEEEGEEEEGEEEEGDLMGTHLWTRVEVSRKDKVRRWKRRKVEVEDEVGQGKCHCLPSP
jgi:hypothetical protein